MIKLWNNIHTASFIDFLFSPDFFEDLELLHVIIFYGILDNFKLMCLSCKSKKVWSFVENRMTGYPIKFDHNQVEELRKKFKKISGNKERIEKQSFQQNMGILGLKSVYGFSDRLFNSFDIDKDGKISFQDFLEYMEVLKSGSQKHKAKISFRLIDIKNKDKVNINEFKSFLDDYFRSWTSITNSTITPEIKERTDQYVNYIFRRVQRDTKKNEINFQYYAEKLYRDKDFTEAFEFITEGVANMFISNRIKDLHSDDSCILHQVLKQINLLHHSLTIKVEPHEVTVQKETIRLPESGSWKQSQVLRQTKRGKKAECQNRKNDFAEIQTEQFPLEIPVHFPKFSHSHNQSGSNVEKAYNTQTQAATMSYHHTRTQSAGCCKNCVQLNVVKKKLDYITDKLKYLIDETKECYERLCEKFDTYKQKNEKQETVGNIHVHRAKVTEGNMIFFGDDNWNLVLNMMIGIQMAVRSVRGYQEMFYEEPKDFNLKYYFELVPRRFGDEQYQSQICSFTDYAPQTFNHIRKIFQIDNEEYIQSIGPNKLMGSLMMGEVNSMTSLTSQGKSGSFFYYTADGKYMLKTIQYREYRFLRDILEQYYYYIKKNPQTLITKFFGLHKLIEKDQNGDIVNRSYFVIMANVFNTKGKIIERYDIKGSWYGRENHDPHPNATKKDNDFKKRKPLSLDPDLREQLIITIRKDAQFFRKLNIIDYSLLIGVIKKIPQPPDQDKNMMSRIANGSEMNLNNFRQTRLFEDENSNESYIFGIIDILTEYSTKKAMQYYFKRVFYGEGISAVPPDEYCDRFVNFIEDNVFKKISKMEQIGNKQSVVSGFHTL